MDNNLTKKDVEETKDTVESNSMFLGVSKNMNKEDYKAFLETSFHLQSKINSVNKK